MHVVLIHGQGRTPMSMTLLGWRLRRWGYQTVYFGYAGFAESFDTITQRFIQTVQHRIDPQPYAIVAHSLGGIITRAGLSALIENPPKHLVMLAPPNQPSQMAKKLRPNALYKLTTGDSGQKLGDDGFYKTLPLPNVPTTVIAGTKGWHGRLSPFGEEINDTLVSLQEARLEGCEVIQVPAVHSLIMNSRDVAQIVAEILEDVESS